MGGTSEAVKDALRRSQYMWTLNCNVSYREEVAIPEFSKRYRKVLDGICREMEFKLEEEEFQQRHAEFREKDVGVVSFEYHMERGDKNRQLHAHGIVRFDGYVRVDETRLQTWIKSVLVRRKIRNPNRPHGVVTSFRYYKDAAAVRKAYVRKDQKKSLEPDRSHLSMADFTVDELRDLAKEHQIPGRWKAKKHELWSALQPYLKKKTPKGE